MTTIAHDAEKLAELDADTRRAWTSYSERLRELTGESTSASSTSPGTELQTELRRLERDAARRSTANRRVRDCASTRPDSQSPLSGLGFAARITREESRRVPREGQFGEESQTGCAG